MEFSLENRLHASEEDEDEEGEVQHKSRGSLLAVEMEHMFEKVVTPSDVGKLNRLVIPKQHAEKYFPLDASSHEKGLLLSFEDRSGRPWRFRYSYWNSSQSYVMTKGWSRFVKEKHLDAGDTVSFGRGTGHTAPHRLFIDWKRCRPESPRLVMPSVSSSSSFHPYLSFSRSTSAPWVAGRLFIPRPSPLPHSFARSVPAVLDSVLVGRENDAVAPKCVRLFGVNLGEAVANPLGADQNSSSS